MAVNSGTQTEVVIVSVEAGLGLICNLLLIFTLMRTWKQWRMVRLYVSALVVGNVLEVIFTLGVFIGWRVTTTWNGSEFSCKVFMAARSLGPILADMAVAAMSLHVLMTSLTGSQGGRARHVILIGLSVLFSLPVPISKIPMYQVLLKPGTDTYYQCVDFHFFLSEKQRAAYHVGAVVTMAFFPLCLVILASTLTLIINCCTKDRGGDARCSDVVLSWLCGGVVVLCSLPFDSLSLYGHTRPASYAEHKFDEAQRDMQFLLFARPVVSAFVIVIFCYCSLKAREAGERDPDKDSSSSPHRDSAEMGVMGEMEILVD